MLRQYKETYGHYSIFRTNKYYVIKNEIHGLYISLSLFNNAFLYTHKGYYNMGMEYSHWLEFENNFFYYL